jgi:ribosome-binding protein aMBF1 (putative translation factor)
MVKGKVEGARYFETKGEAKRFGKKENTLRPNEEAGVYSFEIMSGPSERPVGSAIPVRFISPDGSVQIQEVAKWFGMSSVQLAGTVGVQAETLHRVQRAKAAKTQSRVREMLEIVGRVAEWAGGKDQAMAWYRAEPLPAFGGRTAEALVKEGKATAVRDYLDHVALGGFA